ncbi:hypothetical protein FGO68_gene16062 [Halteria grandinella]|uniref:Uncharacterized protein n=1 Tax=Halteria grandinella TaxID=5974 RepID=A0A8J8NV59_HALGN|nr:hypothetical protein FGO68_gene16062 [Halteria grandinella]
MEEVIEHKVSRPSLFSTFGSWINRRLESIDRYGHPVSLTYKGDQKYKSSFGGMISLIGILSILVYFGLEMAAVFNRSNSKIETITVKKDLADPSLSTPLELNIDSFNFGIKVQYVGSDPSVYKWFDQNQIDRYFSVLLVTQKIIVYDTPLPDGNSREVSQLEHLTKKCPYLKPGQIASNDQIKDYTCPEEDFAAQLKGASTYGESYWLRIQINRCQERILQRHHPNKNWTCINDKNKTDALMKTLEIQLLLMNKYFDQNEYNESPIKTAYRTYVFYAGSLQALPIQYFSVTRNQIFLDDSIISNAIGMKQRNLEYATFQPLYNTLVERSDLSFSTVAGFNFLLDNEEKLIKRQTYTIFDAFSSTGGFYNVLSGFLSLIVSSIGLQQNLLFSTLINKFIFLKPNKNRKRAKITVAAQLNKPESVMIQSMSDDLSMESFDSHRPAKSIVDHLLQSILTLRHLTLTKLQIFIYCIRQRFKCKANKRENVFTKAKQNMEKCLEVEQIIERLNKVDYLERVLLKIHQQQMEQFARQGNIIEFEESSGDESKILIDEIDLRKNLNSIINDQSEKGKAIVSQLLTNFKGKEDWGLKDI